MDQITYSADCTQSIIKSEFNDEEYKSLRELLSSNDDEVVKLGMEMIKVRTYLNDIDILGGLLWNHII